MKELSDEQKKELEKITSLIQQDAKLVIKEYQETPSELSGSSFHFHQNSPFLKED